MSYADRRSRTQHDTDRIIYSSAFRRLAGVTQVVAVREIQPFHNRLTHTLKVAQLARRLVESMAQDPDNAALLAQGRADLPDQASVGGRVPDPDAVEAAALAHDIGHPPFGHIAEGTLDDLCIDAGLDGFEANAQGFRVVTKLAWRNDPRPGLDLSPRTLNGILKYPYLRANVQQRKWGAYTTEAQTFAKVREGLPPEARTLEATIMDWVDDIAYALHDLEDFYRAGMIPLERVLTQDVEMQTFLTRTIAELDRTSTTYDHQHLMTALGFLQETLKSITSPYQATVQHRRLLHRFTSTFITRYMGAVTLSPAGVSIDEGARHEVMLLKQITWQYVMNNPALTTVQQGQIEVIKELFRRLCQWVKSEEEVATSPTTFRLPTRLAEIWVTVSDDPEASAAFDSTDDPPRARRARIVTDYIASLSEDQVLDLHGRLCGLSKQSVLEGWIRF